MSVKTGMDARTGNRKEGYLLLFYNGLCNFYKACSLDFLMFYMKNFIWGVAKFKNLYNFYDRNLLVKTLSELDTNSFYHMPCLTIIQKMLLE